MKHRSGYRNFLFGGKGNSHNGYKMKKSVSKLINNKTMLISSNHILANLCLN